MGGAGWEAYLKGLNICLVCEARGTKIPTKFIPVQSLPSIGFVVYKQWIADGSPEPLGWETLNIALSVKNPAVWLTQLNSVFMGCPWSTWTQFGSLSVTHKNIRQVCCIPYNFVTLNFVFYSCDNHIILINQEWIYIFSISQHTMRLTIYHAGQDWLVNWSNQCLLQTHDSKSKQSLFLIYPLLFTNNLVNFSTKQRQRLLFHIVGKPCLGSDIGIIKHNH